MRGNRGFGLLACVLLLVGLSLPAGADLLAPNDDVTTRAGRSSNYNSSGVLGLLVKGTGDFGWIEFTLGSVAAQQANLLLQNYWDATGAIDVRLRGNEFDFSETALNDTNKPDTSAWPILIDSFAVTDAGPFSLDVTSFYNANLGRTVSFKLEGLAGGTGDGPIFVDREGTNGQDPALGPRLQLALIPEPHGLLLLGIGLLGLRLVRRRA